MKINKKTDSLGIPLIWGVLFILILSSALFFAWNSFYETVGLASKIEAVSASEKSTLVLQFLILSFLTAVDIWFCKILFFKKQNKS